MRYDRDIGPAARRARPAGGGRYGGDYGPPYPRGGFSRGFLGRDPRASGATYGDDWAADPERESFGWGGGYAGRGYGEGPYDLPRGHDRGPPSGTDAEGRAFLGGRELFPPGSRGGYGRGAAGPGDEYGPARYGYGPYYDRLRRRRRDDDEIRAEVEDTLFYDTWVDADAIRVRVSDGVVSLAGTLPSFDELRYAVDDAWDVEGVRGVRSDLEVDEQARRWTRSEHLHGHPEAGDGGDAPAEAARAEGDSMAAEGSQTGGKGVRPGTVGVADRTRE